MSQNLASPRRHSTQKCHVASSMYACGESAFLYGSCVKRCGGGCASQKGCTTSRSRSACARGLVELLHVCTTSGASAGIAHCVRACVLSDACGACSFLRHFCPKALEWCECTHRTCANQQVHMPVSRKPL